MILSSASSVWSKKNGVLDRQQKNGEGQYYYSA
jgi:hypothetical protein